jgi:hypothetical protein
MITSLSWYDFTLYIIALQKYNRISAPNCDKIKEKRREDGGGIIY